MPLDGLTMEQYFRSAVDTNRLYPEEYKIIYPALGLGGESGEVLEKIKKGIRDKGGNFDKEDIIRELGDVLWYLCATADDLGYTLDDVAWANIKKLEDRRNRNKIKGDGDNR